MPAESNGWSTRAFATAGLQEGNELLEEFI